jgi:hypothetical protein
MEAALISWFEWTCSMGMPMDSMRTPQADALIFTSEVDPVFMSRGYGLFRLRGSSS